MYLQHELDVFARRERVDNEVAVPLASQVTEDLLDDLFAELLILTLVVGLAEVCAFEILFLKMRHL